MRATGWSCDVCGAFSPTEEIPEGWFVVTRVGGESAEACSPKCICSLGTQLKQLEKVPAPDPAGGDKPTVKCPICEKPCKGQQGKAMHMRRTHPDG